MKNITDKDKKLKFLQNLLQLSENDKTSLKQLANKAFNDNLIDFEYLKSCNGDCKVTTIKRYLRSIIKHLETLNVINNYVMVYSQVYSIGSKFYNAFLLYCFENNLITTENDCKTIIDQTFIKYALLPFKSELSGRKKPTEGMYDHLWNLWDSFGNYFINLYPSKESFEIVSWDQPLTRMQAIFKVNFENHVVIHYNNRVEKYILHNIIKKNKLYDINVIVNGVNRKAYKYDEMIFYKTKLLNLIKKGDCKLEYEDQATVNNSNISENIIEYVKEQRKHFGFENKDNIETKKFKFELQILMRHFELLEYFGKNKVTQEYENLTKEEIINRRKETYQRMNDQEKMEHKCKLSLPKMKTFSVSPLCRLQRSYTYIDNRVIESLINKNESLKCFYKHHTLDEVFQINRKQWKKTNKKIRKKIRRNKKSSKQKKKVGYSLLPKNIKIQSITTDGVGVAMSIYLPPEKIDYEDIKLKKAIKNEENQTKKRTLSNQLKEYKIKKTKSEFSENENYHIIAFDEGRENLFQSVQKDGDSFVSTRLKDNEYKRKSKVFKHREWYEEYKKKFPEYQKAIEKLSEETWRTGSLNTFLESVNRFAIDFKVHYKYNVTSVQQSKWRMLLWRKKLSIMSQIYSHTIRKVKKSSDVVVVMAIGDAKITSTGLKGKENKRHGGCPTNGKHKIMERTLKCMNIKYKIIYVDEFNTTQCCYKCENKMKDHFENNKTVRGLKDCHHCSENAIKTRNRDLNASINIFKITECFIKGYKRPEYLQRKKCS